MTILIVFLVASIIIISGFLGAIIGIVASRYAAFSEEKKEKRYQITRCKNCVFGINTGRIDMCGQKIYNCKLNRIYDKMTGALIVKEYDSCSCGAKKE